MSTHLYRPNKPNLKQQYQEHVRYIRNNPQSAYAQHILNNRHEYGTIEEIIKLIKPTTHTLLLIPYEALFIQLHQQKGQLITEQTPSEPNPLFQLYLDTTQRHLTNRSTQTDAPLKASFLQDSAADRHKHRYVTLFNKNQAA
jgi:hypothetical protein